MSDADLYQCQTCGPFFDDSFGNVRCCQCGKFKEDEMKYRKKPVVIDAVQYNGRNLAEIMKFASGATEFEEEFTGDAIQIFTLEGVMTAQKGDWIIKGIKGEFYPCKPDIFEATYELVEGKDNERTD